MSLEGKTAVVIGASGQHNFGVAIAKALANEGAKVIVSGRRQAPLETLASEIGGIAIPCDMGDEASIQSLFQSASEQAGPIHIAINSAGGACGEPHRSAHPRSHPAHPRCVLYWGPIDVQICR